MSQQIYIPFGDKYPIPYEFEADTLPVPRGQSSVLWELRDGNLTAAEAIIYRISVSKPLNSFGGCLGKSGFCLRKPNKR